MRALDHERILNPILYIAVSTKGPWSDQPQIQSEREREKEQTSVWKDINDLDSVYLYHWNTLVDAQYGAWNQVSRLYITTRTSVL